MMGTNKVLKERARGSLEGNHSTAASALLLYFLLLAAAEWIFFTAGPGPLAFAMSAALSVILLIFSLMLQAGLTYMFLGLARDRRAVVYDLFYACRTHPDNACKLSVLLLAINLAIMIPFSVISYRLLPHTLLSEVLAQLVLAAVLFIVDLRYAFVFCIFADSPFMKASEIMKKSRLMTLGHHLHLARLLLSFAGYLLLSVTSLGIGFLWTVPYIQTTISHFYLDLLTLRPESSAV